MHVDAIAQLESAQNSPNVAAYAICICATFYLCLTDHRDTAQK